MLCHDRLICLSRDKDAIRTSMTRLYFMDESLQESAAMFLSVTSLETDTKRSINEDVPVMIQLVPVAYNNKSYVLICEGSFALGYLY